MNITSDEFIKLGGLNTYTIGADNSFISVDGGDITYQFADYSQKIEIMKNLLRLGISEDMIVERTQSKSQMYRFEIIVIF